jgi:cell division protein FtsB
MEDTVTVSRAEYEQLKAQSAALAELQALAGRLRAEIALLKNGHSSKTGSTPPSQDIARSNTVHLRIKSGKKSGG